MCHHCPDRLRLHVPHGDQLADFELSGRDGSRLIRADNIRAGERFDRFHLLNKRFPAGKTPDTEDERHRREEHQSLRDHADDAGHGADNRFAEDPGSVIAVSRGCLYSRGVLAAVKQKADRYNRNRHDLDDPVDRSLHLGRRAPLLPGLCHDRGRVALVSDPHSLHGTRPRDNKAPRKKHVARLFLYRPGFAGQHRLIDFHALSCEKRSVCHNLVADAKEKNVVPDDLLDRNIDFRPVVPQGIRSRCRDDAELVDQLLYLHLLRDADDGVADDHTEEKHVLILACHKDQNTENNIQEIEIGQRM